MSRSSPTYWHLVSGALCALLSGTALQAQALPTATREAEYYVFAGGSSVNPDYGYVRQPGFVAGAGYTRFPHFFVYPGLELRASISPKADAVGQRVFSGGLRVSRFYGRFSPYADFLVGTGVITYVHPLLPVNSHPIGSDNSIVYTYGGGVDVEVTRHFSARAEFQGSHWNLALLDTLTPTQVNFGVVWRTR